MLAWQAWGMTATGESEAGMARGGNLLNGGAASYQVYATSDGRFITLGALEAHFWSNFCDALGRPDWIARQHETLPQTALIGEVAEAVAAEPLDHWEAVLKDVDCCYHAVLDYTEAARDLHAKARGLVTGGENGAGVLFPAWVDGEPPEPRAPVLEVEVETALERWGQSPSG